jgi:ketosteroid isomerase-like protein
VDILGGGLDALRRVAELPRWPPGASPAVRDQLLAEEAVLRDELLVYGYAMDAGDVDAVMTYFSDDVAISNPRGRYQGSDIVRKNYEYLFSQWAVTRHVWANVIVRFPEREDEAYRASYIYGFLSKPGRAFGAVSSDVHKLRKIGGRWKIVERAITDDLSHTIEIFGAALEKKPDF